MKKLVKYLVLSLSLLSVNGGKVFSQKALTLDSAIELALSNNLDVKIVKNQSIIAGNNASLGNAGLLPSLSASGGMNYTEHAQDDISSNAALNFSYTLFDGFNGRNTYQILQVEKDKGELNARYNIENIIFNVVAAFYDLVKSHDDLMVYKENLEISKDRLRRNETKYEFGNINKLDVLNAKVDFNRDSSSYLQAKKVYEEAVRGINVLLGQDVDEKYQIISNETPLRNYQLEELKEKALNENADYLLKKKELHLKELAVQKETGTQLPSVKLQSAYTYYDNELVGTNSHTRLTGGISVSFNIFNGKQKKTAIVNAKIQQDNAEYDLQNKMLALEKDVVNAFADYHYNVKKMNLEKDALEAAELNFKQTREYYHLGQVTATGFREAQLNLLEARNNLSSAQYNVKLSDVNIERISGELLK